MLARMKIGLAVDGLERPLRELLDLGRRLGVTGLQFDARKQLPPHSLSDTGRRQFVQELKARNLQIAAMSFITRHPYIEQAGMDARLEATREAMQFAFQLGCRILTIRVGKIPSDPASADYELLRNILNDLVRFGNHIGITPAILPTGDNPQGLAQLLREINQGPIGVNYDPVNFLFNGQSPTETLRMLHPWIVQYRLRDGQKDYDGLGIEVPMGRGELDWNELFALFHESEFSGWLVVDRTQGDDRVGDLTRAVQFAKTMIFEE
ncbi:MAG: sugar phosphate isomerase/epimerase [Planctomycetota bacterium]|nr:sugar phosphate isomerase/epimerase [Planctomycetota bacterium]MDA1212903.1 sugar phosphate isomerase/epimerase [Planctomycetota bacterium]